MDVGTLEATLILNSSQAMLALKNASLKFKEFEAKVAGTLTTVQKSFDSTTHYMRYFGRDMSMYVTLPMVLAGGAALKMGKDFEIAMQRIVGLVGISQKQVNQWSQDVLALAPEVGKSPKELAEALYYITSSGYKGAESLDILKNSAKAAAAGLGETQAIADLVTSAMNAYKNSNLKATEALDILTAAVREGKGEAKDFARQMGDVIPIAQKMGVSFDQVAAAMSAVTLTGTSVSEASTQVRQILVSLLDPARESEKALHAMGTSSLELRKIIVEQGLLEGLKRLNVLTTQYGEQAMGKVFGNVRALTGVLSLLGDRLKDNEILFNEVKNSAGDFSKAFESVGGTIDFVWNQTLAAANVSAVQLTAAFKNTLIPILRDVGASFVKAANYINSMSDEHKKLLFYTLAVGAAIGPLSILVSVLARAFSILVVAIKGAIAGLSRLMIFIVANPWLALGVAIAAVAAYLLIFKDNTNKAAEAQENLNKAIQKGKALTSDLSPIINQVKVIKTLNKEQLESLKTDINAKIENEKQYTEFLKGEYQKRVDADRELSDLKERRGKTPFAFMKKSLDEQIKVREAYLDKDYKLQSTSQQKNLTSLNLYLKAVNGRLEYFDKSEKPQVNLTPFNINEMSAIEKAMQNLADGEKYIALMTEVMGTKFDASTAKINLYKQVLEDLVKAGLGSANANVKDVIARLQSVDTVAAKIVKITERLNAELEFSKAVSDSTSDSLEGISISLNAYKDALEQTQRAGQMSGVWVEFLKNKIKELDKALIMQTSLKKFDEELKSISTRKDVFGKLFNANDSNITALDNLLQDFTHDTIPDTEQGVDALKEKLKGLLIPQKNIDNLNKWSTAISDLASGMNSIGSAGSKFMSTLGSIGGSVADAIGQLAKLKETQEALNNDTISKTQAAVSSIGAYMGMFGAAMSIAQQLEGVLNDIFSKPRRLTALEVFVRQLNQAISRLQIVKDLMDSGLQVGASYAEDIRKTLEATQKQVQSKFGTINLDELANKLALLKDMAENMQKIVEGSTGGQKKVSQEMLDRYNASISLLEDYFYLQKESIGLTEDQIDKQKELGDAAQDAINKLTFTDPASMSGSIVEAFTSGMQEAVDKGIKPVFDFAKNIRDILRNAIIQAMSISILEPLMKKLQAAIASDMQGQSNYSEIESEYKRLSEARSESDKIMAESYKKLLDAADAPGLDNASKYINEFVTAAEGYVEILNATLNKAGLGFESSSLPGWQVDANKQTEIYNSAKESMSSALSSGIEEGLDSGKKFVDIFGGNLKDVMRKALIQSMSAKMLTPMLDEMSGVISSMFTNRFNTTSAGFNPNVLPYIKEQYGEGSAFYKEFKNNYELIQKAIETLVGTTQETAVVYEKVTNAMAEAFTSGIKQGLEEGTPFVDAFGGTLNDVLKKAVIDAMSARLLEPMINSMTTDIQKMMENPANQSAAQLTSKIFPKYGQGSDFYKQLKSNYELIQSTVSAVTGTTQAQTNKNGLEGTIKGATEETVGLLAGQFNALRIVAIKIEKNTAEIRDILKNGKITTPATNYSREYGY